MNSIASTHNTEGTDRGGAPVQLENFQPAALDRIASRDRDGKTAARRLERLEADKDLYTRLQFASFEGPDWDQFERELVRYAFAVLRAWIATGVIRARVLERVHKRLVTPPVELTEQDAEDLAVDTIVRALEKFRVSVLAAGKWDPTKGANLKTFWIGFCILKYPDLFDKWCTEQRHWLDGIDDARRRTGNEAPQQYQDPAKQLDVANSVDTALASVADTTAQILVLQEMGFEHVEIAELLDITVKSIESRIYRHRRATNAA